MAETIEKQLLSKALPPELKFFLFISNICCPSTPHHPRQKRLVSIWRQKKKSIIIVPNSSCKHYSSLLKLFHIHVNICCCLVDKSCPTLCDPMDCSPPGKNTEKGCYFLLQGIFLTQGSNLPLLH